MAFAALLQLSRSCLSWRKIPIQSNANIVYSYSIFTCSYLLNADIKVHKLEKENVSKTKPPTGGIEMCTMVQRGAISIMVKLLGIGLVCCYSRKRRTGKRGAQNQFEKLLLCYFYDVKRKHNRNNKMITAQTQTAILFLLFRFSFVLFALSLLLKANII